MTRPVRFLVLATALLAQAGSRLWGAEPPPLKVMMEHASPPFVSINPDGRPEGFAIDLLNALAADQKLRFEMDLRPWQQVYAEFKAGRGDVLALAVDSPERAAYMDFSLPFETLICGVYYNRNGAEIRTVDDLRGRRLAVMKNAITHEYALKQSWGDTIVPYASFHECLQAVEHGQADAALGLQLITDYQIRKSGFTHLARSELAFPEISYRICLAVQPGNKALLAKLNEGLYNLRLNDTHDALHEKWLGPLEPQKLRWRDVQPFLLPLAVLLLIAVAVLLWQRRLLRRLSHQARALRENEERLQLVFEGSQDGFWDWHVSGANDHVLRSPRWAEMLGYTLEEVPATREAFVQLVHPGDLPLIERDERRVSEGRDQFTLEFRMRAKSGEWKWILDRGKVVARDPATGRPLRITGTHTDITARKFSEENASRLEQKMQEAQKLESLGVLAGGIAHDFNNLLTVVLGNASLARLEGNESPANVARLDDIITAADRAAELCRQLLAYAGKGSFSVDRLNLNEVITETTRLLELSISKQARLDFALAPALPPIEADPSQMRQIIMNLVINASEAIGEHNAGTIGLATHVVTLPWPANSKIEPIPELPPGKYVCVEITDTGCGMPPDVIARIFDPFFTTKFTGRGLGLAAVLGIVRTHQGTLRVFSTAGKGSTFRIYLPVSQRQTSAPFPTTIAGAVI